MWPFKKKDDAKAIDPVAAAAIIMSTVAIAASLGVARWSWLILDEQLKIRAAFTELSNHQTQTDMQYEYWLGKLKQERIDSMKAAGTTPPPPAQGMMLPPKK